MTSESKGDCTPSKTHRSLDSLLYSYETGTFNSYSLLPYNKRQRVPSQETITVPSTIINHNNTSIARSRSMMQHSSSCTALPELESMSPDQAVFEASTGELDLSVSPATFVRTLMLTYTKSITHLISGEDVLINASSRVQQESYFLKYLDEHLAAYTLDKVSAVQAADVTTLRTLHASGQQMQASNRFGESILHTSCRRGLTDVVRFFLTEAHVSPRVRDDMGRTPMHDACWLSGPPNHDVMLILIGSAPEMLLSRDKRGHSPFDYARREYWPNWVAFLNEHRQFIVNSLVLSCLGSRAEEVVDSLTSKVVEGISSSNDAYRVVG